jgi:hypothetical protein
MRKPLPQDYALALAGVAQVIGELTPVRDRLAKLAAELPASPADLSDAPLSSLELTRASLECVLADHLDPAIAALVALLFPEEAHDRAEDPGPIH